MKPIIELDKIIDGEALNILSKSMEQERYNKWIQSMSHEDSIHHVDIHNPPAIN